MDLVARLPWWSGVGLAAASYFLLHGVALQPVPVGTQPGQMAAMVTGTLWKSLAGIGQYILPVLCLVGAAMSWWRRRARQKLAEQVTGSEAADALDGMGWQAFEQLVGEAFRMQGYRVAETGGPAADGGVDLVLARPGRNGSEKFLVQCKQWRALKVGVDVVRELYGVMAARGAAGGFVVTSGRFTEEAIRFASGRNVHLIDGPKLQRLLNSARAAQQAERTTEVAAAAKPSAAAAPARATDQAPQVPACPRCAKPMVRRTARRGGQAGDDFWGCAAFPACRGTRPMA